MATEVGQIFFCLPLSLCTRCLIRVLDVIFGALSLMTSYVIGPLPVTLRPVAFP